MKQLFFIISFLFVAFCSQAQFRLAVNGVPSWTNLGGGLYSATVTFHADLTGNSYAVAGIVDTMRLFTSRGQVFEVDSVWGKTFSQATLRVTYVSGVNSAPVGQGMVYAPNANGFVPDLPFGSTGATAQFNQMPVTYNASLSVTNEPAGSNTEIQYNNSAAFGASSFLTYNPDTSLTIGNVKVWNGTKSVSSNVGVGANTLTANTTGNGNIAVGQNSLSSNTTGSANTAIGRNSLVNNTTGSYNTAHGHGALFLNTTGSNNTAHGFQALLNNTTGSNNIAIGDNSGRYIADGISANAITNNSVYLGSSTKALANNQTNQIVIGHGATGLGDSTAVLGAAMKKVRLGNNLTFKTDQTIGAGQDNYVLTYDHSAGSVSLEAAASGADGNGIYSGDGTAPAGVDVTVTDSINFDAGTLIIDGVNNRIKVAGAYTNTSGTHQSTYINGSFAAGAGSANYRPLDISYTINNSGVQSGTATGIFLNATETALNSMVHNLMDLRINGSSRFSVTNNGAVNVNSTNGIIFSGGSGSINTGSVLNGAFMTQYLSASSYTNGHVFSRGSSNTFSNVTAINGNDYLAQFFENFAPTSGTATATMISVSPTINQTGGANGITRGLYVKPTLTSAADWRSIETSNTTGYSIYTASAPSYFGGNVSIGTASASRTLHVAGEARITDLTTDTPTRIVGADADGDLGAITVGSGLNLSGGTLTASGGSVAGSNTEIQFNASGAFGASALLTYSTADSSLAVNGIKIWKGRWGKSANTAVGESTLTAVTTGTGNTAIGSNALRDNTIGVANAALGYQALLANTIGSNNCALGYRALYSTTDGGYNAAMGAQAMNANTSGGYNAAFGYHALYSNTTGNQNTAFGYQAGRYITGSSENTSATNSVFVGAATKALANNQTNQIVIGHGATGLGDSTAVLGAAMKKVRLGNNLTFKTDQSIGAGQDNYVLTYDHSAGTVSLEASASGADGNGIYSGDGTAPTDVDVTVTDSINFDAGTLFINGVNNRIGIGTVSPQRTLQVTGEARITDLTTDTPTRLVGADADGDLGAITVGSGLNLSGGTLTATGGVAEDSLVVGHVPYVSAANTIQTDPAGDADAMAYDNSLNILTVKRIKLKGGSGTNTELLGRNTSDYNVNGITVGANLTLSSNILSVKDTVYINLIAAKPGVSVTQTAGHDYYDATFLVPNYLDGFNLARVDYAMTNSTATTGSWTVGIRLMSTTNTSVTSNGCAATFNAGDVRASSSGGLTVSKNQWLYIETNTAIAGTLDGTNEGLLATLMFVK